MKKPLILSSVIAAFLIASATNVMAHDRHSRYNDHDRIAKAKHLDRKGDRIEARLDRKAATLDARGKHCKAAKLRLKGDRINAKLDRKAERIRRRS